MGAQGPWLGAQGPWDEILPQFCGDKPTTIMESRRFFFFVASMSKYTYVYIIYIYICICSIYIYIYILYIYIYIYSEKIERLKPGLHFYEGQLIHIDCIIEC